MKHKTITCLLISVALLVGATHSKACTSIIVSGKVTPDGRPYIFKNRDTHDLDNLAIQIQGSHYRFIGIVAAIAVKTLPKGALVEIEVIAEV